MTASATCLMLSGGHPGGMTPAEVITIPLVCGSASRSRRMVLMIVSAGLSHRAALVPPIRHVSRQALRPSAREVLPTGAEVKASNAHAGT